MIEAKPVLRMEGITKRFPGVLALDHVDFSVQAAEVHALVGENGAGKSTLMKILGGAYQSDGGQVFLEDRRLDLRSPRDAIRAGVNVVYQEPLLAPHLSAAENILMGQLRRTRWGTIDWKEVSTRADAGIGQLGVRLDVRQPVANLSMARQQVVEIARALQHRSKVLVLDEPSAVLSQHDLDLLFGIIRHLTDQGVAVVYISHRLNEVFQIARRVTVLKDGQFVGTEMVASLTTDQLVRMMIGRQLANNFPPSSRQPREVALEVQDLTRSPYFIDVSFNVRAGEILGIAGLVGSGRTEVARAIFGADVLDQGQVRLWGRPVQIRSPGQALTHGLGLLPEDRKTQGLLLIRPIEENITISSLDRYAHIAGVLDTSRVTEKAREMMEAVDIRPPNLGRLVSNLSGGNQQKVGLAKWLSTRCRVLIFDEPTRGVDVGAKWEIYELMNRLATEGVAIIMISSEIPEILGLSDRVLVMRHGRVVGEFSRAEATEAAIMQKALIGEENHGS